MLLVARKVQPVLKRTARTRPLALESFFYRRKRAGSIPVASERHKQACSDWTCQTVFALGLRMEFFAGFRMGITPADHRLTGSDFRKL